MRFDKAKLAVYCRAYGQFILHLPDTISGGQLLWALSGMESSYGQNCNPRHEAEYCPQKHYFRHLAPNAEVQYILRAGTYSADIPQVRAYTNYGCLACSSFTPWQIMLANAVGFGPLELMSNLETCAQACVSFMNRKFSVSNPLTLADIAHLWNGSAASAEYIAGLTKAYQDGLPSA